IDLSHLRESTARALESTPKPAPAEDPSLLRAAVEERDAQIQLLQDKLRESQKYQDCFDQEFKSAETRAMKLEMRLQRAEQERDLARLEVYEQVHLSRPIDALRLAERTFSTLKVLKNAVSSAEDSPFRNANL